MCEYEFDARKWEEQHEENSPVSGLWSCPHGNYADSDYCILHQPTGPESVSALEVSTFIMNKVDEFGRKAKQFVGARIPGIELPSYRFKSPDNIPINFAHSTITGEVNISQSVFEQDLILSFSDIGELNAIDTEFRERGYFQGVSIEGEAEFSRSRFHKIANFESVEFESEAFFTATEFNSAMFDQCKFKEGVLFFASSIQLTGSFNNTYFDAGDFTEMSAETLIFENSELEKAINLQSIECNNILIGFHSERDAAKVDFMGSNLYELTIKMPNRPNILYNFSFSELGECTALPEDADVNIFEISFFNRTKFRGFDFSRFHEDLEDVDWTFNRLHSNVDKLVIGSNLIEPSQMEDTYFYAKVGAKSSNDPRATSKFLKKELRARRQKHRKQRAWRNWTFNRIYDLISVYGQSPSRVFATSLFTVALFGGVYCISLPVSVIEATILSFQSFVTLISGAGKSVTSPTFRLFSSIEGFLGAFLIALFVYSLTEARSIS